MKKPNITEGKWKSFSSLEAHDLPTEICRIGISYYVMTDGDPCETAEQDAKAISAVPEMVDALIETRTQLTIAMSHEDPVPTSVLVDWCTQVEYALKKAGVEL